MREMHEIEEFFSFTAIQYHNIHKNAADSRQETERDRGKEIDLERKIEMECLRNGKEMRNRREMG